MKTFRDEKGTQEIINVNWNGMKLKYMECPHME